MNKQTFSIKTLSTLKVVVLALVLGLGISYAQAVWTGPTAPPTGNNVEAPVNIGSTAQIKTGDLTVGNLTLTGSTIKPSSQSNAGGLFLNYNTGLYTAMMGNSNSWVWYVNNQTGDTYTKGTATIAGGSPAAGKVLTATNVNGDATWQAGVRPTVTYVDNAINLTSGGSYTFPANAYAIQGSFNAGSGGTQNSYVDYRFNGNTNRRIGGLLNNGGLFYGTGSITASIPFTIFVPAGKTSVTFDFIGTISNFVIHQLITT